MYLLSKTFIFSALAFIFTYLLRGLGVLSFVPGGLILFLLLVTISSGLMWGIISTLRY